MANTKVTGDLIASGTITADNLVSGTLDTLLNSYLTTNTYATQGYVTTAVNNLIAAAPASLDTLNELAAALNDDANFATTVTNSLATKLNLSGGTMTGALITTSPLTIQDSTPYIQWKNASGTRLGYIQHNETDLVMSADTGYIGLDANTNVFGNIKSEANEGKLILNSTAANGKQYEFISIDTGNFGLYDGTAYRLWINGNGNIGVRSTNPGSEISSNATVLQIDDSNVASLALNHSSSGKYEVAVTGLGLDIRKDGSNKMLINTSGNVGIGTTSPSTKLHIAGTGNSSRVVTLGTSGNSYAALDFYTDSISAGNMYFIAYGSANAQDGSFAIKNNSSHTTANGTSGDIWFASGGSSTEKLRILAEGGITFNGDTAAANALDDYEEGSFTPTLNNAGSPVYGVQYGRYTKIGNLVFITLKLEVSNITTGSQIFEINGIPFNPTDAADNKQRSSGIIEGDWVNMGSYMPNIRFRLAGNGLTGVRDNLSDGSSVYLTYSNLSSSSIQFNTSLTYRID